MSTLVLTGALKNDHSVAEHVHLHGDGVKTIGLRVRDCKKAYETAIARGAKSAKEPEVIEDENGKYISASVYTYGETLHTFVERKDYKGFAPGFKPVDRKFANNQNENKVGLAAVDHVVGNVEVGRMDYWVDFYQKRLRLLRLPIFRQDRYQYAIFIARFQSNGLTNRAREVAN